MTIQPIVPASEIRLDGARVAQVATRDHVFYFALAIVCALVVFAGFSRSYFLKDIFGTPKLPLLFHVHGFVFSLWMLFLVLQTWLVKDGRTSIHRRLGYGGAVLASLMVILAVMMVFASARMGHFENIPGATDAAEACLFSLFDAAHFGLFVWAGFFWRLDRQAHQRFMVLATVVPLLPSAIGRLSNFQPAIATPMIFAFFLVGPIYDLITRRRVHWAYVAGLLIALLTGPPLRILLGRTEIWHMVFHSLVG